VIGFVGGRSIFASVFTDWLTGQLTDDAAVLSLAGRLSGFAEAFGAGRLA
jgi:myo-inositol catabolism protein IolC